MRKLIQSKKAVRFSGLILALMLMFSCNAIAFAAESNNSNNSSVVEEVVQPRGVLSGYNNTYTSKISGSFTVNVTGSWSAYAGCTIKTEGFSSSSSITVSVYDSSGSCKTTKTLGANEAKENIAILNVSPGTYTVIYSMTKPSSGTIHVWIY